MDAGAESAGLLGVGAVHPMVLHCIEEIGMSVEGLKPKPLTKEMVERAEFIVGFGQVDSERTPVKFEASEQWSILDPSGLAYGSLCEVRDEIARNIDHLLDRLGSDTWTAGTKPAQQIPDGAL